MWLMCCAGAVLISGMGGCKVGGEGGWPACNCEFGVVKCGISALLRSTINGASWTESASVSASYVGKLDVGISEKIKVMQLALSH
jgi:hypothetical protein